MASALSTDLNALVQYTVKGPATIYDKAMDAEYLATYIGGGNHRMFDGEHTIVGAVKAIRDAWPDDTIIEEAMGFLESIFRDMSTPKGLPLANWDKATYDQVAEYLKWSPQRRYRCRGLTGRRRTDWGRRRPCGPGSVGWAFGGHSRQ